MSQDYIYCFQQGNPNTLVLLKKSRKLIERMVRAQTVQFLWIEEQASRLLAQEIQKIQSLLDIKIHYYFDIESTINYINSFRENKFIIICSTKFLTTTQIFYRKENVLKIICYQIQAKTNSSIMKKFQLEFSLQQEIIEQLRASKQKIYEYKELPCFNFIKDNIQQSNQQIRTMFAMLNQNLTPTVRCLVANQLDELMKQMSNIFLQLINFDQINSAFLLQMKEGEMNLQRAIYWYTRQSPIYKLTNSILRSSKHPCQSFYIQPFFKDLFRAVWRLYQKQNSTGNFQQFVCYRGGTISQHEIQEFSNNVGQVVQNLGFLSTSLEKKTGHLFISNVLFVILVRNDKRAEKIDYGYAFLSQYSQYHSESEILFNPLNSFKVLSVRQVNDLSGSFFQIVLKYGELARIQVKQANQLSQKQKQIKSLSQLHIHYRENIKVQGDALFFQGSQMEGSLQYWLKFYSISTGDQQIQSIHRLFQIFRSATRKYPSALPRQVQQALRVGFTLFYRTLKPLCSNKKVFLKKVTFQQISHVLQVYEYKYKSLRAIKKAIIESKSKESIELSRSQTEVRNCDSNLSQKLIRKLRDLINQCHLISQIVKKIFKGLHILNQILHSD